MTPAARLAATAEILDTLDLARPVEAQLKAWARGNRYAGSKDRRAIADRIYAILRRWRSSAAQGGSETGRMRVLGSLAGEGGLSVEQIAALCSGGYGLSALGHAECETLSREPEWRSEAERLDWPEWLWDQAVDAFGEDAPRELDALRRRAPVDLRVNMLKATPEQAIAALLEDGISETRTIPPTALRLPPGAPVIKTRAWCDGLVELQDVGSQAVAAITGAQPGETVLDACAGGGGKTLALAAAMENTGRLLAADIDPARMADLPERAARAGVTCIEILRRGATDALDGVCDRVLVDAPCSGSGSWRRDPAGKWRLTPAMLAKLTGMQDEALDDVARFVRPGGTLVYATCSILRAENEDRVTAFLTRHSGFEQVETRRLHPARDDCDGFFAARLTLTAR